MEKPSFFAITEHIYTEAKDFWPLIRVKTPEGFISKWYTNNSTNNDFSALENKTLSAGNTGASIVQIEKDTKDKIPHFIPATNPPVGVLKTDRKRIFAGIDNKMIDKVTTSQYPLLYAYTTSSEGLGTAALVKLTVQGRMERAIREYTLHGDDVLTADGDLNNSTSGGSPTAGFDPVLISLIRRSMPNLVAYDLAGVQPMSGPTGLIFAMRSRYSAQDGTETFYNEVDTAFSGQNDGNDLTQGLYTGQASEGAAVGFGTTSPGANQGSNPGLLMILV